MADFLSRLVERSTGRAPVLRPATFPLFAAQPAMAAELAGEEVSPLESDSQDPALSSAPTRVEPSPIVRRSSVPDSLASPQQTRGAEAAGIPAESGVRAAGLTAVVTAFASRPPTRHGSPRIVTSPKAPTFGCIDADAAVGLYRLAPRVQEGSSDEMERREPPDARIGAARLHPAQVEHSLLPVNTSRPRETEKSALAPIVRISIGRIEVRAVTPPQVPSRPAPPRKPQGPSLEEYLRPRSRGR